MSVEAENPDAITEGVQKLFAMTEQERKELGKNGHSYILEHFTYDKLAQKYEDLMERM